MLYYHGKPKGTIVPLIKKDSGLVSDHPFFGIYPQNTKSVEAVVDELRGVRYDF